MESIENGYRVQHGNHSAWCACGMAYGMGFNESHNVTSQMRFVPDIVMVRTWWQAHLSNSHRERA